MDEYTGKFWSYFLKEKAEKIEKIVNLIWYLRRKLNIKVEKIRGDKSTENKMLQKECENQGMGIVFEYTERDTPEQNGKVERKFGTLYARMSAMLNGARLPERL